MDSPRKIRLLCPAKHLHPVKGYGISIRAKKRDTWCCHMVIFYIDRNLCVKIWIYHIGFRVLCNKVKYKNATIRCLTSPNCYILLLFKLQNATVCCFLAHQKRRTPPGVKKICRLCCELVISSPYITLRYIAVYLCGFEVSVSQYRGHVLYIHAAI